MRWPLIKYLPDKTNLKFVGPSRIFAVISAIAVIGSLFLSIYPATPPCGGLNCGVDFKGGTVLEISTAPRPADLGALREALGRQGLGDVQVQGIDNESGALLRFETPAGQDANQVVARVRADLERQFAPVAFKRQEVVGPKVSGELFTNGVLALLVAIGLMMVYIWFRFGLTFGIGAVVALFHDVILTFGLFAIFKLEFTLVGVASILTIIGYSMNDTVVVLDRIRENLRKYKKMPLGELIDLSINETLSRTLITGITAVMVLAALAIFGGEALFGFSIALMFGIICGTYSSIYVGAPIILLWGVKRGSLDEAKPIKLGMASRP